MKKSILALGLLAGALAIAVGQGTIYLDNYRANAGLYFGPGVDPAAAGTMVMILGGSNLTSLAAVSSVDRYIGTTVFTAAVVNALGPTTGTFFRAGYGRVPGTLEGGSAFIELLAWYGAADFAAAKTTPSAWWYDVRWTQEVGSDGHGAGAPFPAPLAVPVPMHMQPGGIPEPSPVVLAGITLVCRAIRRRLHLRRAQDSAGKQL